jgi:hypothetical protein
MRDIALGKEDMDLVFENGDIVLGESTRQHQVLLLNTSPGEWRESPTVGVGVAHYLLDEINQAELAAAVKRAFEGDGMTTKLQRGRLEASYDKSTIEIDGNYR